MSTSNKRLLAIDILRGLTIIFMIIVNDPGSWGHVYAPLLHAEWNGLTPTDYIFPTFLFIMGASVVLSLSKRKVEGPTTKLIKKIVWRTVKIYLVGLFLWLWPDFNFNEIRWAGVLQRIAIVYLACSLIYIFLSRKNQIITAGLLLLGYLIVMCFIPIPEIGFPDLSVPEKNWAHYIDKLYLPGVMWEGTWDPEGILSTFPAIVTGMLGMFAAYILQKKDLDIIQKSYRLFLFGACLLLLGDITQYIFPINKHVWSTSFVLMVGGISTIALTISIYLCDIKGWGKKFSFAQAFGVNPIFAYALAGMLTVLFYSDALIGVALNRSVMDFASTYNLPMKLFSFLYACFYTFIIWIPTKVLFNKKIYLKL